jgi:trehalose-6-phosphatase
LQRYDGLLIAVHGSATTEILPDIGWATGDTVRQILESHEGPALALYAGSFASDSVAFEITAQMGGVTIGVGPSAPTNAMHQLPDSESLVAALSTFFNLLSDYRRVATQLS